MNNNNKRKNRPLGGGGGGGGGGTGMSRYNNDNRQPNNKTRPPAQGVYNNAYFMHAATALVGNVVQMRLRSGNVYEGVFRTFSHDFDVALELPSCIKTSKNASEETKSIPNVMIFPYDTVVSISAKDFDSQYATVGAFQTDAAISEKCNGTRFDEKELEPWDPTGMNGDVDIELEDSANGWDANDMFRKNENAFGVQSTFDDSLSSYTVPLDKIDSDEFKEREAKAEKLAAEIENNPACRDRLDLENGDEEALFSAVLRPDLEREREREREQRERELIEKEREREREKEREREDREQREQRTKTQRYEPPIMTERYITKPTRSITGPPPSSMSGPSSRGHDRGDMTGDRDRDRNERMISSGSNTTGTSMGSQMSSSQSSVGGTMNVMKNSSTSTSQMGGGGGGVGGGQQQDKYGSSMMKRKPNTQQDRQKMIRNTPPPNSGGTGGMSASVGPAMSQSSGGGSGGGSSNPGGQKPLLYNSMPMQNQQQQQQQQQTSYQTYSSSAMHGGGGGAGSSYGRGPSKINGDNSSSNPAGKPMQQRPMRQYSGSSSNSSMNYNSNDNQNQGRHVQHGSSGSAGGNSNSPPLQGGVGSGPHVTGAMSVPHQGAPPPQPQRQMRTRDNQMQDLRQFGQDFQLANTSPSPGPQPVAAAGQQSQPHLVAMNKGGHQPQPSVSPPQQQQQQAPPPHIQQQQQQHVVGGHVSMQHHVVVPATQPQQHYVPAHLQTQHGQPVPHMQQQPQKTMQHVPQQHVAVIPAAMAVQHVPQQPLHIIQQQPTTHIIQEQPPPPPLLQQQTLVQATSQQQIQPTQNITPTGGQQQQQQQQQTTPPLGSGGADIITPNNSQTQICKSDSSATPVSSTNASTPGDKATSPASNITPSGTTIANTSVTGPPVKKTHVLNPSAKPFTPRSPSTPNPSRPHTPQTPIPMTIYSHNGASLAAAAAAGQQTPIYMMPQQPTAAFHAPAHPQPGQQTRMRRGNYAAMTPSQMHASAATGQPLLATGPVGPMPTHILQYQQTPHAPHFQSQPYATPMVRMYEPQQLQFLTQTPPSTTPSPGQPHQTFHPQPQPSPAGGGQPTFAPQAQTQYQILCPLSIHPTQLMHNAYYQAAAAQHPPQGQQFQIIMPQQHPTQ